MSLYSRLFEADKATLKIPHRASMMMPPGRGHGDQIAPHYNSQRFIDAYNDKTTDNPITHHSPLGHGTEGSVYKTKNGVVKAMRSNSEAKLANTLEHLPKYKSLPAAYQKIRTGHIMVGPAKVHTIEKEDLHNLHPNHEVVKTDRHTIHHLEKLNSVLEHGDKKSIHKNLIDWKNHALTSPEIPEHEKKHIKNFAHGLHRMTRFGVHLGGDLADFNFGRRSDGSFAIRDIGYHYIHNDTPELSAKRDQTSHGAVERPIKKYKSLAKK